MVQVPESSSYHGKKIGIVHNPQGREAAEANLTPEAGHYIFSQDEGDVDDPLQELGCLSSRSKMIGTEGIPVEVLPTYPSPSHPFSGHTQNTSLAQPALDMCSANVGKAAVR